MGQCGRIGRWLADRLIGQTAINKDVGAGPAYAVIKLGVRTARSPPNPGTTDRVSSQLSSASEIGAVPATDGQPPGVRGRHERQRARGPAGVEVPTLDRSAPFCTAAGPRSSHGLRRTHAGGVVYQGPATSWPRPLALPPPRHGIRGDLVNPLVNNHANGYVVQAPSPRRAAHGALTKQPANGLTPVPVFRAAWCRSRASWCGGSDRRRLRLRSATTFTTPGATRTLRAPRHRPDQHPAPLRPHVHPRLDALLMQQRRMR